MIKFGLFILMVLSVLTAAFAFSKTRPAMPVPSAAKKDDSFDGRFGPPVAVRVIPISKSPVAAKGPKLEVAPSPQPPPAPVNVPLPVVEVAAVAASSTAAVEPRRRGGDLCERHGLRKIETNGGRSWRCRK